MDPNQPQLSRYYNFRLERDLNETLESWLSAEVEFFAPELPTIAGSIERHPLLVTDLLLTLFVRGDSIGLIPHPALTFVAL